jgi:hypothetical protein
MQEQKNLHAPLSAIAIPLYHLLLSNFASLSSPTPLSARKAKNTSRYWDFIIHHHHRRRHGCLPPICFFFFLSFFPFSLFTPPGNCTLASGRLLTERAM